MKVVFIIPYYGEFPNFLNLFLKTCENNAEYNWIIFSDNQVPCKLPKNVYYIEMSFGTLKRTIQEKLGFQISLKTPYKLCDYKPAYGIIFQDYIKQYDYWGYTDVDLILGDLKRFIPYDKIKYYDKIGCLGHLTLYRNSPEINKMFTTKLNGNCRYKEVFQTDKICVFDEWDWISINHIFQYKKKKVWMFSDFFDIYPNDDNFKRVIREIPEGADSYGKDNIQNSISFASIEDGRTYQWLYRNGKWSKKEVAYVHFQKRNMKVLTNELSNDILCVPDKFIPMENISIPRKYVRQALIHRLINRKKMRWKWKKLLYLFIVKTSSIRHPFRKKF